MWYASRLIKYLERENDRKDARITALERAVAELVDNKVYGTQPSRILKAKMADFQDMVAKDEPPDYSPKDAYTAALDESYNQHLKEKGAFEQHDNSEA